MSGQSAIRVPRCGAALDLVTGVDFTQRDGLVVILLCGGDKSSQTRDIRTAKELVAQLE